jgi:hypothetical protein
VLWLNGGPSHVDTFDPKPGTAAAGPFKAIDTKIAGVQFCEHLPLLAARADQLAVLRGLSSKEGNHDRARHLVHTGYSPNPTVAHPSLGGWWAEEKQTKDSELPGFISLLGPSADAGFLGVQYNPFVVRNPNQPPANVTRPGNVDADRFARRTQALGILEDQFAQTTHGAQVKGRVEVYDKAYRLMATPKLKAFDLGAEPAALKASYGDTDFGRGCLLARRLVEAGVGFVEVTLDGWDTHQDNFGRTQKLMGALDPALSALLDDLAARQLLDSTLVVCMGEFGRTPKINDRDGRDHHPGAWSGVVAGGGIRAGQVLGQTDATGEKVVGAPLKIPDLMATFAVRLGLDPAKTLMTPLGRPLSITDSGKPFAALL